MSTTIIRVTYHRLCYRCLREVRGAAVKHIGNGNVEVTFKCPCGNEFIHGYKASESERKPDRKMFIKNFRGEIRG